jgi:hypothetical protein
MTTTGQPTPRTARARTLRDELLDDLRQAAPMPAARTAPAVSVSVSRPVEQPPRPAPERPTVELRATRKLWWGLRLKTLGEGPGFVVGAGPVQISLTGFGR